MRQKIIAAVSAGVAGLALAVIPATGAFASSNAGGNYGCSDGRGWDDRRNNNCDFYDNRYDRNFNNSVIFIVL
ncbi:MULTISPECIES: hypothetical protein [unclassified Streptomyces]|uniref:hypothetical protein n=1 Tax=unclassified Streptomyces TaxID=2593676 RepID=UPI0028C44C36|nr:MULTISPECIES: hypothetical protein [unclassified Streptomyces]WNO70443.1 hypothetical protein RPQ07_01870 [Streptomyces sp. AM8-1-1]